MEIVHRAMQSKDWRLPNGMFWPISEYSGLAIDELKDAKKLIASEPSFRCSTAAGPATACPAARTADRSVPAPPSHSSLRN